MSEAISTEELAELERLAKKAMPGPWYSSPLLAREGGTEAAVWGPDGDAIAFVWGNLAYDVEPTQTASYIAALNPATALRLIEEIRELRKSIAEYQREFPPLTL